MSREDLVKGLRAIDDDEVRRRVASGDVAAAGALELTGEEAALLRGAAEDYPEVSGFAFESAFDSYLKIDSARPSMRGIKIDSFQWGASPGVHEALDYVQKTREA